MPLTLWIFSLLISLISAAQRLSQSYYIKIEKFSLLAAATSVFDARSFILSYFVVAYEASGDMQSDETAVEMIISTSPVTFY